MSRICSPLAAGENQFKSPAPRRKTGKVEQWETARKQLKIRFEAAGITECEAKLPGCWRDQALGFGHLDKRRFLTEAQLWEVVLLCSPVCHDFFERLPRTEMRKRLQAIIDARVKQP